MQRIKTDLEKTDRSTKTFEKKVLEMKGKEGINVKIFFSVFLSHIFYF